jgi:hypothetical protein
MDKVLYTIKNIFLGYDACYNILGTIETCFEDPNAFVSGQGMNFKDFIIREYYIHVIDKINIKRNVKNKQLIF